MAKGLINGNIWRTVMNEQHSIHENEAFGHIQIGRVNSSGSVLHGSNLLNQNYISLEVSTGSVIDKNNGTVYYHKKDSIVRICLTPLQWAELLSSMNGSGVPCTLERVNGKCMPNLILKDLESKVKEGFANGLKSYVDIILLQLSIIEDNVKIKGSRKELKESILSLKYGIENLISNIKYSKNIVEKSIDTSLSELKLQSEAYLLHLINNLGKECLTKTIQDSDSLSIGHLSGDE